MPAQSSLEGLAKLMAAKAMIGGAAGKVGELVSGDARAEKRLKKRTAKAKAAKAKQILKDEDEAHKNWLRENGSYLQAIRDRISGSRRIDDVEEAHLAALKEQRKKDEEYGKQEQKLRDRALTSGRKTVADWDNEQREKGKEGTSEQAVAGQEVDMWAARDAEVESQSPTIGSPNIGPDSIPADISASSFNSESIVSALEQVDKTLIEGLGTHTPPFLETLTKSEGAPSIVPESIGADSAPDVSATPDVSMETMLDGEPMPVQSDQFEELLVIEREELDFDRRREAREIKEARLALEDRRDKKLSGAKKLGLGGMKPDKKKKDNSSLLSTLFKFGARYLLPMVSGWVGLKTILGLSTKADDAARAAKAAKNAARLADEASTITKNISTKADDAARLLNQTDEIAKVSTKVDDVVKPLSKADDVVNATTKVTGSVDEAAKAGSKSAKLLTVGDDVVDATTKVTKLADGVPSTNLGTVTGKVDEAAKGITTSVDEVGKGVSKVTGSVDEVGKGVKTVTGKMDTAMKMIKGIPAGTAKAVSAVKATTAVTKTTAALKATGIIPSGAPTLNKTVPGGDKAGQTVTKASKAGAQILDAGMKPVTETVQTVLKVTKGAGKLATTIGKYLAPLDLLNKMGQGQGMWESMGNMVLEIGNLAAGAGEGIVEGVQHLAGGSLGEGGFSDKSAADIAFQDADLLGNKEKWQTSYLEQGINKGVAFAMGTEQIANKKVYTEEQEKLAFAAENDAGAVDIGFGQGEIEDLQALSLLDEKTLEALLAYEVFSDDDQKQIEDLLEAKKMGLKASYESTWGGLGDGKINYEAQGQTAEQKAYAASLDPSKRPDMEEYVPEGEGMFAGMWDKFASFFEHTPDVASADKMAETTTIMAQQATTPGSIFTHDTHLEKTLWDIWTEEKSFFDPKTMATTSVPTTSTSPASQLAPLDNQELIAPVPVIDVSPTAPEMGRGALIPSELLAQIISQISAMEKQPASAGGMNTMVNSNTRIDNSVRSNIMPTSTAFAPEAAKPAGIGRGA